MFFRFMQQRKARAAARRQAEYDRGYGYAASQLLRGVDVISLEADLEMHTMFSRDAFDDGAEAALQAWLKLFPESALSDPGPFPPLLAA